MALAGFGKFIDEGTLESEAQMEEKGTPIDEVERLAKLHNLVAEIRDTTVDELRRILVKDKLAIAFIDRAIFELTPQQRATHSIRNAKMHCVIPTRITEASIMYHDPLRPHVVRRSIRLFERAHQGIGGYSVVCSKPRTTGQS